MDFENLPLPGSPLALVETYIEYDGPRTFALRATTGEQPFYFVNAVDEDERSLILLAVRVSEDRFKAVRAGVVPFRAAFTDAGLGELFTVVCRWGDDGEAGFSAEVTRSSSLTDQDLPSPEARLDLPTATVEPFERQSVLPMSRAQNRTILAVELNPHGSNITEFPSKNFGEFSVALSGEVDALRLEAQGSRGDFRLRPSIVGMRAASFVVLFAFETDTIDEPIEWTGPIVDGLNDLLIAAANPDTTVLLESLSAHINSVRTKFREILGSLAAVDSGIELTSVVAGASVERHSSLDAAGVRRAQQAILHVEPAKSYMEVRRGVLVGLNVSTRRFELWDSSTAQRYKGYVDPPVIAQAHGLVVGGSEFLAARIRVEIPFAMEDDPGVEAEGARYYIEAIGVAPSKADKRSAIEWMEPEVAAESPDDPEPDDGGGLPVTNLP